MGNKCGVFPQSYPDAPVLHVEKLSVWTGCAVSEAQGKLWDKRLAGRDGWGWRGEEMSGWREARGWKTDSMFKGEGKEAIECMNKLVRRDKLWGEFWVKVSVREVLGFKFSKLFVLRMTDCSALSSGFFSVIRKEALWLRWFIVLYLIFMFLARLAAWRCNVACLVGPTL